MASSAASVLQSLGETLAGTPSQLVIVLATGAKAQLGLDFAAPATLGKLAEAVKKQDLDKFWEAAMGAAHTLEDTVLGLFALNFFGDTMEGAPREPAVPTDGVLGAVEPVLERAAAHRRGRAPRSNAATKRARAILGVLGDYALARFRGVAHRTAGRLSHSLDYRGVKIAVVSELWALSSRTGEPDEELYPGEPVLIREARAALATAVDWNKLLAKEEEKIGPAGALSAIASARARALGGAAPAAPPTGAGATADPLAPPKTEPTNELALSKRVLKRQRKALAQASPALLANQQAAAAAGLFPVGQQNQMYAHASGPQQQQGSNPQLQQQNFNPQLHAQAPYLQMYCPPVPQQQIWQGSLSAPPAQGQPQQQQQPTRKKVLVCLQWLQGKCGGAAASCPLDPAKRHWVSDEREVGFLAPKAGITVSAEQKAALVAISAPFKA
jgi:hypothetical protein